MKDLNFVGGGYFYSNHIRLTGSPEEDHRIPRLNQVIGYVQALEDLRKNDFDLLLNKVGELKDHKGILTVYWTEIPQETEKNIFEKAWSSRVGDGSDNVEHEIFMG